MPRRLSKVVRRYTKQGAVTAGTVLLSVVVTTAVVGRAGPAPVAAQPGPADEVRASAFVLVRADGTEIARLRQGGEGGGFLTLFDAAGKERFALTPLGFLIYNADGVTPRLGLGTNPLSGAPGINLRDSAGNLRITFGVNPDGDTPFFQLRDPDGTTARVGFAVRAGRSWFGVRDAAGVQRMIVGQEPEGTGDDFGVTVRGADGSVIGTVP
jgi:hypothetical protein